MLDLLGRIGLVPGIGAALVAVASIATLAVLATIAGVPVAPVNLTTIVAAGSVISAIAEGHRRWVVWAEMRVLNGKIQDLMTRPTRDAFDSKVARLCSLQRALLRQPNPVRPTWGGLAGRDVTLHPVTPEEIPVFEEALAGSGDDSTSTR